MDSPADPAEAPDFLTIAIDELQGPAKAARALGVSPQRLSNWRKRNSVPTEFCIPLEEAVSGKVTRYQLRPDVYGQPPVQLSQALEASTA